MGKHYDFCSFFVIPALTFLLAAGNSLTAVNFSVIGNREGQRGLFLLWGAVTGNYFYLYVRDLLKLGRYEDRWTELSLFIALALFLCGIGLPYLPRKVPILSRLHVWASFGGAAALFICLYRLLHVAERKEEIRLRGLKGFQLSVAAVSAWIYFRAGMVSSLLEMFVTFSTCVYLALLQGKLEKIRLSNH